jgi:hypothetical protein
MTLSEKQKIFTFNIAKLITEAYRQGYELTFGEVFRTPEQQKIYFDTGRSKTMNSRHLDRLAVDFNIFKDGVLLFNNPATRNAEIQSCLPLGEYWISLNTDNVWGGDWDRDHTTLDETFKDPYHFEQKP